MYSLSNISLRYRITITIFVLVMSMLVAVLFITLSFIEKKTLQNSRAHYQTVYTIVENLSRTALFSRQYDQLQQTIEELAQDPQVVFINLSNKNNIIVVSSDFSEVGTERKPREIQADAYVYRSDIKGLGILEAEFSYNELTSTIGEARDQGIITAMAGAIIIAIISFIIAGFLTRRLRLLATAFVDFDETQVVDTSVLKQTNDEVGKLTSAFLAMTSNISDYMAELRSKQNELHKLNEKLQELSEIDGLTGIANRRKFEERFSEEVSMALRTENIFSVIMVDVDFFKNFNDTYGHTEGDKILKLVARTIANSLPRKTDFVARYGGEEFIILLPLTDAQGAFRVAENIRHKIEALEIPHSSSINNIVTISMGIDVFSHDGDLSRVVHQADKALYAAKTHGRNCTEIYGENRL